MNSPVPERFGPVMLDIAGPELSTAEAKRLAHPLTGGVILFTRNYQSVSQLKRLVAEIRAAQPQNQLLIGVDHEGGRVQRFREGFTRLPAAQVYGHLYRKDTGLALHTVREAGWVMAVELLALGVDFSFAPVLDVDSGISQIIGDRSFSGNAGEVLELALAFASGVSDAGMPTVGKHFPGHGGVALDSHISLPVDQRNFEDIEKHDLIPFSGMIRHGLDAVMPAHVIYQQLDDRPAGFSRYWLQDILRQLLGFDGVIFSDDLSMEGAAFAGGAVQRARAALGAGCDMILVCNQPEQADEVLAALEGEYSLDDWDGNRRLAAMQGKRICDKEAEEIFHSQRYLDAKKLLQELEAGKTG